MSRAQALVKARGLLWEAQTAPFPQAAGMYIAAAMLLEPHTGLGHIGAAQDALFAGNLKNAILHLNVAVSRSLQSDS